MHLSRFALIALALLLIASCKIRIIVPEGGHVVTKSGVHNCASGRTCTIDVVDIFFDETFTSVPAAGYKFQSWKKRGHGLCGGKSTPCRLYTSGFEGIGALMSFLASDEVFYLEPRFESQDGTLTEVEAKHQARKLAYRHVYELGQEHEAGIVTLYADIDLDNDNDRDIVGFYSYDWNRVNLPVTIFRNNGGAGYSLETTSIVTGSQGAATVADFNGDGLDDIYYGDSGYDHPPWPGKQDQLFMQTAEGGLAEETHRLPELVAFTHSTCAADFDNDGDVDIYAGVIGVPGDGYAPSMRILDNDGSGNFQDVSLDRWPSELQNPEIIYRLFINSTACGVLDRGNGGPKDLILGDWNAPNSTSTVENVHVALKNNGHGFFGYDPATSLLGNPVFPDSGSTVATALHVEPIHYNDDLCEDALIYSSDYWDSHNRVALFKADCLGGFEEVARWEFSTEGVWLAGVAARDLNADGRMDFYGYTGSARGKDGVNSDKDIGVYAFINQGDDSFVRRFLTMKEKESLPVIRFITMDFDSARL